MHKKGCLITILIAMGFFIFSTSMMVLYGPKSASAPKDIGIIMQYTNTDKDQAAKINEILKQCDITNIKEIKHDEILDNAYGGNEKGYRITNDLVSNIIMYLRSDNSIYVIKYADNTIYDNNNVLSKLSNYVFTLDEKTKAQINSEKMIKDFLKSPTTADFPNINEWTFYKDKEKTIISSYVDAQNSFGVKARQEFKIILNPDGKTVKTLIIDGKEYK
jgi:hypothetical protein